VARALDLPLTAFPISPGLCGHGGSFRPKEKSGYAMPMAFLYAGNYVLVLFDAWLKDCAKIADFQEISPKVVVII
jgi:hypothetical protein